MPSAGGFSRAGRNKTMESSVVIIDEYRQAQAAAQTEAKKVQNAVMPDNTTYLRDKVAAFNGDAEAAKRVEAYREQRRQIDAEKERARAAEEDYEIRAAILKDNARRAVFAEVMPVVIEVLNKYKGRAYGEKTKDKIAEEVYAKTGATAYISTKYLKADTIAIYYNDFVVADIEAVTKYDADAKESPELLVDNKIVPPTMEQMELAYCGAYIEDVDAAVAQIKAAYKAAADASEAAERAVSAYNAMLPTDIPRKKVGGRFYGVMWQA